MSHFSNNNSIDDERSREYNIHYERRSKFDIALDKIDFDVVLAKVESKIVQQLEEQISRQVSKELDFYLQGNEFKSMIDYMKRKERERIISEIDNEMKEEKLKLIAARRAASAIALATPLSLTSVMEHNQEEVLQVGGGGGGDALLSDEAIILQNKIALENRQRSEFEKKLKADALRLQEVQFEAERRRRQQVIEEAEEEAAAEANKKQKQAAAAAEQKRLELENADKTANRTKLSIGLVKKRF